MKNYKSKENRDAVLKELSSLDHDQLLKVKVFDVQGFTPEEAKQEFQNNSNLRLLIMESSLGEPFQGKQNKIVIVSPDLSASNKHRVVNQRGLRQNIERLFTTGSDSEI